MSFARLRGLGAAAALLFAACASTPSDAVASDEAVAMFETAWQAVNDTHYDPTFNGVDWNAVHDEFLPRVKEASSEEEVRGLLNEMLGRLEQSHFVVIPEGALPTLPGTGDDVEDENLAGDFGFDVRLRDGALVVNEVVPGGPADHAGVKTGWLLTRIGDDESAELLEQLDKLDEREAAMAAWQVTAHHSIGAIGTKAELAFLDGEDREVTLELERAERDVVAHAFGNLPTFYLRFRSGTLERGGKEVGWIHFTNWFLPMVGPINAALDDMRGLEGIVIDLRGNTGGALPMVMGLAGHFFEDRESLGTMTTRENELEFVAAPRKVDAEGTLIETFHGPVAILVDETSGSASEVFSGGMQSTGRARVFGETTAGAVLPSRTTTLPNGDAMLHALGDFKTSTGVLLEGDGVVPDVHVPLTREALLAGKDPQLETALAWITGQDAN